MNSKKRTVLLIEDNPYNREIAEIVLDRAGYRVVSADDGEKGLELIKNKPDLVLLDLSLPKISGWDIVKRIREDENYADIPIIALTAHAMVGDREKALRMGCSSYLSKPCLPEDIVKEVESFIK